MVQTQQLWAPQYRQRNDYKGFHEYLASLDRVHTQYELSMRDHQDALIRLNGECVDLEAQRRYHHRFFRDFFERRSILRQLEQCDYEMRTNNQYLVDLHTTIQGIVAHRQREEAAFYDNPFLRKVKEDHPKAHDAFLHRMRTRT